MSWVRSPLADGVLLRGADGTVRIRSARRPLRSAAWIFARAGFAPGTAERLITCEGEHAALRLDRARGAAVVFGDDTYTLLEAWMSDPAKLDEALRAFAFYCPLGLGHARRRRYLYTPPPGWEGVARGLDADWRPPGYPGLDVRLTVHAALPAAGRIEDIHASLRAVRPPGRHVAADVFADGHFFYPVEVDAAPEHAALAEETLARVVRSIQPVPPPAPRGDTAAIHWAA